MTADIAKWGDQVDIDQAPNFIIAIYNHCIRVPLIERIIRKNANITSLNNLDLLRFFQ